MNITIIGTGYVGLVTGVCLSEFGFDVTCVDTDSEKIASLRRNVIPIYEPGLDQLIQSNAREGRLHFSDSPADCIPRSNIVFLAVGTPDLPGDGDIDMAVANRDGDSATVLTNSGAGSFTSPTMATGADPRGAALGDFDGDGDRDLAVSNHDDRTVSIFTNTGGVLSRTASAVTRIPLASPSARSMST